jgi:hypothetical protein
MANKLATNNAVAGNISIETFEMESLRGKIKSDISSRYIKNSNQSIPKVSDASTLQEKIYDSLSIPKYYSEVKTIEDTDSTNDASAIAYPSTEKLAFERIRIGTEYSVMDPALQAEIMALPSAEFGFGADDLNYTKEMVEARGGTEGTENTEHQHKPNNTTESVTVVCGNLGVVTDGTKLSNSFTLGSLSSSAHFPHTVVAQNGLSKDEIICNLKGLAENVLDKVKAQYPNLLITSGFRRGSGGSQHLKGQAADFQFSGLSDVGYFEVAKWISENTSYDQLLLEYKNTGSGNPWIHVSHNNEKNRGQVMTFYNHRRHSYGLVVVS